MTNRNSTSPRPNLGALALIGMSVLELIVSLATFLGKLYIVAIVFAAASILLTLLALQIKPRSAAGVQREQRRPPPSLADLAPGLRVVFIGALVLGFLFVIGAAIFALRGESLPAITMGLWAVALGMQALRFRAGG